MFILCVALASGLNLRVALRQTGHRRSEMGAFGALGIAKAAESDSFVEIGNDSWSFAGFE